MTGTSGNLIGSGRRKWVLRFASIVFLLVGWELLARSLDSLLFPTPEETFTALAQLVVTPSFWQAFLISNQALVLGFALAAVTGVTVGLAMGRWRSAERVLDPYLNILIATPMSALIPVLILALGLGLSSRVLVVFMFSIVVIVVNTRTGLKTMEPSWVEMAHSFGASERQMWLKVLLPGALPGVTTGLRLGLGRSLTGMVAVELTLIAVGIGRLILDYQATFEAGSVYATILIVIAEAVLLLNLLRTIEGRLTPWSTHRHYR
jgi:NitT/TauT family transport system permease protein